MWRCNNKFCRAGQFRRTYWSTARSWSIGAYVLVAAAGSIGCSHGSPSSSSQIRRSVGGEPASLDPQQVGDTFSFEVLRDLFEGLTAESATGEIVPGAADDWAVTD